MKHAVIRREEMLQAKLMLGSLQVDLADYATTGLRVLAVGPSGTGKTSALLAIAEQLVKQGWVAVVADPEGEIQSLYEDAVVESPDALADHLAKRDMPIMVIPVKDAFAFKPFGEAILASADAIRKPVVVLMDEGDQFSASKKRKDGMGEASDILNDFVGRGRKRGLDMLITALGYTGSLNRKVFEAQTITLIGKLADSAKWSTIANQFRGTNIGYPDLQALGTSEWFCWHSGGVEKIRMQMPAAMEKVAIKARPTRPALPQTFSQWDRAMREIPTERLKALTGPVQQFLSSIVGLTAQQVLSGARALADELEARS